MLVALASAKVEVQIGIYNDVAKCERSSLRTAAVEPSGVCKSFTTHSSIWDCGAAEQVYVITAQSFATSACDSAPLTSHYNYCGECKAGILRSCDLKNNSVTYSTCTDAACQQCTPTATVVADPISSATPTCNPNPLPGVYDYPGTGFQLTSISLAMALKHTWFSSGDCTTVTPPTANDGNDFIVLNVCNNGWMFRCIDNGI